MSHFTVLVIGENIEDQLEPFFELECTMDRDEIRNDPRASFKQTLTTNELEEEFLKVKNEQPEYYYETLDEFANEYHGYYKKDNEDVWGYWTNENSKWDWYEIGGRWTGFFKIKKNPKFPNDIIIGSPGLMRSKAKKGYADSIRLCDIDFEGMKIEQLQRLEKNWIEIQEKISNNDKSVYFIYDINENDTKEDYINRNTGFSTYALLKDGIWYEKGEMGWFGVSSNEKSDWKEEYDKLISSLPENTLLTIVDCHI